MLIVETRKRGVGERNGALDVRILAIFNVGARIYAQRRGETPSNINSKLCDLF